MIKRIYFISLATLLICACVPQYQIKDNNGNSFRTVPEDLAGVDWSRTPTDVLNNPQKDEPLVWLGVVRSVYIKQNQKENKIEIEWLCEHLNFAEPGPTAISVRPIKARSGQGYFTLSVIVENMSIEQARQFRSEHTASPHYMLAGGKFAGIVEREGRRVPFLYMYRFGLGPDLAIIQK